MTQGPRGFRRFIPPRGLLGGALGVREAIWITTIAAIGGVLFLIGSPVLRLRELPEVPE